MQQNLGFDAASGELLVIDSACETLACCKHDIDACAEASDDVKSTKYAHAGWLTDAWSGAGCYHTILWIRE